jgi:NAD(P)-dependent dehydrogenase (short-subunit alcohol dehydrogenase family)
VCAIFGGAPPHSQPQPRGLASALALAAEGARLVVTARRADRLDVLAAQIRTRGSEAIAVAGDAREEETAERTISAAVQTFGGIDLLINNAGVGNYKDLVATSAAEYDELMDSNMRSTFLFTRHTVPAMIARGTGRSDPIKPDTEDGTITRLQNLVAQLAAEGLVVVHETADGHRLRWPYQSNGQELQDGGQVQYTHTAQHPLRRVGPLGSQGSQGRTRSTSRASATCVHATTAPHKASCPPSWADRAHPTR